MPALTGPCIVKACKGLETAMDRPGSTKGLPVIRTRFGEVSAKYGVNFDLTVEAMMNDEAWREAAKAEGGPFCYVPWELDIPF